MASGTVWQSRDQLSSTMYDIVNTIHYPLAWWAFYRITKLDHVIWKVLPRQAPGLGIQLMLKLIFISLNGTCNTTHSVQCDISDFCSFEQGGATGAGIRKQTRFLPEGSFLLTDYVSWCNKVYAAIDCYSWVFSNAYLAPCEVFNCGFWSHFV